jgi:hypothetical protein
MVLSAVNLSIDLEDVVICGNSLYDWIQDAKDRLAVLEYKQKDTELKAMEKQLDSLLSKDKQTELELDDITRKLGI